MNKFERLYFRNTGEDPRKIEPRPSHHELRKWADQKKRKLDPFNQSNPECVFPNILNTRVLACQGEYLDGIEKGDRNLVLGVYLRDCTNDTDMNDSDDKKTMSKEELGNEQKCSKYLLYDCELGLQLSDIDDASLEALLKELPGYLNAAIQENMIKIVPNHEGIFLERV